MGIYIIKQTKGHYEAHNSNGKFVCSGDTFDEVWNEIENIIKAEYQQRVA